MARKTTVTHPDGTVDTRTSKSRVYSHAVVREVSREALVATAQARVDSARESLAKAEDLAERLTPEAVTETRKPWAFGGEYVTLHAFGEYLDAYVAPRDEAPSFEALKAGVEERAARSLAYLGDVLAAHAATAAKTGPVYGVVRWSSTEALATKAALGEFAANGSGVKVYVVPAVEA